MRDQRPPTRRSGVSSSHLGALCLLCLLATTALAAPAATADPLKEFAVARGYALEVHATGFFLPTAIEFLPDAGNDPDDPYYFVSELQGRINVVSRDGTVTEFAMVPTFGEQDTGLSGSSQQGLAGVCVAAEERLLFATYTQPDEGDVIRNHIVRFRISEEDGRLVGVDPTQIAPVLADFQSAPAHQVGDCVIVDGLLYVGVGDGGSPGSATDPDVLLGKFLCMDLEGQPCPDPPFGEGGPAAYVYAKGFRNPFATAFDGQRLVVAGNGVDLDRFLPVTKGLDHLWDGHDFSLAALSELLFPQPFSPVQLAFVPAGASFMEPGWAGHYVAAGFGSDEVPAGLAMFGGRPPEGDAAVPPRYLIQFVGEPNAQHMAGVGIGDDGLYVTPMVPLGEQGSVVLRLRYDPSAAHPVVTNASSGLRRGADLNVLNELGCTGCHEIRGEGGGIGPVLDQFGFHYRITERLNSRPYEDRLREMIADPNDPFPHMDAAREAVLAASGRQRLHVWLVNMLLEPRFDDPDRQMPNLGLTTAQATAARDELFRVLDVHADGGGRWEEYWAAVQRNWRPLIAGGAAGIVAVLAILGLVGLARRSRRRRAQAPARG